MANVTMSIDDALLRRARKIALEKNTSVNAIIRAHLQDVVSAQHDQGDALAKRFLASVKKLGSHAWKKPTSRDELYER
ncbi:MAG: hypothetical protein HQL17_04355 [Candidatus Omnitrophica bacterium]|nr:hypothetical protein [Candidatus Omnitrophota bacterium]